MRQFTSLNALRKLPTFGSAADALRSARMDWGVDLEPLQTVSGTPVKARAVVRADTRKPLGVVGTSYAPIDNLTATQWVDQYIPHGLRINSAKSFKGGERCILTGTIGEEPAEVQKGDAVALRLIVSWSHDGSSATTATLSVLRLACTNGLVLASEAGRMFSLRHTRNADPSAEEIQAQVRESLARFDESMDAFRALAARPAPRAAVREYAREVMGFNPHPSTGELLGTSARVLDSIVARFDDSRQAAAELVAANQEREARQAEANASLLDAIVQNFDGGRGQEINGGGTWWNAYNAVTEYLTHERGRSEEAREESLLFGSAARLNERALGLAMNRAGVA